jgi:hypothetical protein
MVYIPVQCPHCQSTEVIKAGKQPMVEPNAISVKTEFEKLSRASLKCFCNNFHSV